MRLVTTWIALQQEKDENGDDEMVVRAPSGVLVYLELEDAAKENDPNRRLRDREDVWREIQDRLDRPANKGGTARRMPGARGNDVGPNDAATPVEDPKAHAVRIR